MTETVLLTDYAWPDDIVEREVIEGAGFRLVSGSAAPARSEEIERLVQETAPAAIMTCWARVSAAAINAAPELKIVARLGVGLDNIDVDAATRRGTWVTNVPDYCVEEVADHAVAFALAWTRGLTTFDREVRQGRWEPSAARLRRLSNLTCGIVGYGRIGRATALRLAAFGATVIAHEPRSNSQDAVVKLVSLDGLLEVSDIVILHVPLIDETRHLIDRARLAQMKQGSLLINVSRGAVVDTDALIESLQSGHLSGAGLDVLEFEPEVPKGLRNHPGAMFTPHVAFSSDASLLELRRRAAEEVVRVLRGEAPEQPCNRPLSATV